MCKNDTINDVRESIEMLSDAIYELIEEYGDDSPAVLLIAHIVDGLTDAVESVKE